MDAQSGQAVDDEIGACQAGVRPSAPQQLLPGLSRRWEQIAEDLSAVWLGHGTVLLRIGGQTVLVDPVFSQRVGPRFGPWVIGPHRRERMPVAIEELSTIDIILLTHAHYDHLDKHTLRALVSPRTVVLTAPRTATLVPRGFADVLEIGWGEEASVHGVMVRATPTRHWGARNLIDFWRGHNGYLVSAGAVGGSVLLGGDSAHTRVLDRLAQDAPGLELAVIGIGCYDPWTSTHAYPEEAWDMFLTSGARLLMPVHHRTFSLGSEPPEEPMRRLLIAAGEDAWRIVGSEPGQIWMRAPRRTLDNGSGRSTVRADGR